MKSLRNCENPWAIIQEITKLYLQSWKMTESAGLKKHKPGDEYYTWCLYAIWNLSDQNCRRRGILQSLYNTPLFLNFKNSPKIQKYSDRQKKHNPGE